LLLKNGRIIENGNLVQKDVLISGDKIAKIEKDIKNVNVKMFDLNGKLVIPGAVDVHVHLREPGFSEKETYLTGTSAAVKGGVTTLMAMPNTNPVPDSKDVLLMIHEKYVSQALAKVFLYGAVTMGQKGKNLANFREMKPYIKALTDDGICISDLGLLKEAMYEAKKEDLIICSHAEAKEYGLGAESEVRAVERELNLVAETGCKYHFCHLSTSEAVDLVRLSKTSKLDVTCEVAPHHIFLCQNNMQYNPNFKMSPALRSHGDMRRTLQGLISGVIDMLATDHAPHTEKEKSLPMDKAPNGVIGLETLIPLAYTGLVRTGKLTFEKMMDVLTFNAAKRFNLPHGKVEVGGLADLAVLDIDALHVYTYDEILSKGKNSPFIGTEMFGMNKLTTLNGNVVFNEI